MNRVVALFAVSMFVWSCSPSSSGPDRLVVHLNNATIGNLEELKIWERDLGSMKVGESKTLVLNEMLVQHSTIVAPYDGILDGERLGQIIGWCGTGMELVTEGEYFVDLTTITYDKKPVLWFTIK